MRKRDESKKEAIIEAAINLINDKGFAETSISKIARKANVSPATIYIYFENKEDLINKLYLHVKLKVSSSLSLKVDNGKSWEENFKAGFHLMAAYMINNSTEFSFMMQCANNPMLNEATREEGLRIFNDAIKFFEIGIKQGVLKPLDHDILFAVVSAPLFSLVNTGLSINSDLINQLAQSAWDAVKI